MFSAAGFHRRAYACFRYGDLEWFVVLDEFTCGAWHRESCESVRVTLVDDDLSSPTREYMSGRLESTRGGARLAVSDNKAIACSR
ncbi:MAG: hypothetical protein MI923_29165 [Phycisphaerales bacterium]|nr:hypothetical protein [Phycisphaerales bacterium]